MLQQHRTNKWEFDLLSRRKEKNRVFLYCYNFAVNNES